MADWLKSLSLLSTVMGGAAKMVGQQVESRAMVDAAVANASILRQNKVMADMAAIDALDRAQAAVVEKGVDTQQRVSEQRAALAANGIVVDQGSALETTIDTVGVGTLDAITILANAKREAMDFRNRGIQFENQAKISEATAKNTGKAGAIGVGTTAFGTLGTVASKWYSFSKQE